MNLTNKSIILVFLLSLFSLAAYQGLLAYSQKDADVLGQMDLNAPPSTPTLTPGRGSNGVPCAVIEKLQQEYCRQPKLTFAPKPSPACTPDDKKCIGPNLFVCLQSGWRLAEKCPNGCLEGVCLTAPAE